MMWKLASWIAGLFGRKIVFECDWGKYGSRYDSTDAAMGRPIHRDMSTAPPWAKWTLLPRSDGDGANFMGMIPRSDEPADKLAALEAQSGAMTSLSVAISRRLDACLSNPQAWESQMRTISECGAHLPSARWARLALIIEKCMPHLQEELRELEAMASQDTGLKETEK